MAPNESRNAAQINRLARSVWAIVGPQMTRYLQRWNSKHGADGKQPNSKRETSNRTVWALARMNLLRSEHDQEVFSALARYWSDYEPDPEDQEEMRLYEAWRRATELNRQAEMMEEVVTGGV